MQTLHIFIIIIIICIYLIYNNYFPSIQDDKLSDYVEKFEIIKIPNIKYKPLQEFYHTTIFPHLNLINSSIIKEELANYIKNNNNWTEWPEYDLWKNNKKDNYNLQTSWTVIPLVAFTKPCEKNIKLFPNTMNQLKQIPNVITAGFSKLGPGTKLSFHKGWAKLSNNVLRCHLGLRVEKNKCKILVTKENNYPNLTNIKAMYQQENKWIIFDDSLYHSATNDSDQDRIVLILDIVRPPHVNLGTSDIAYSEELDNFMNEFI